MWHVSLKKELDKITENQFNFDIPSLSSYSIFWSEIKGYLRPFQCKIGLVSDVISADILLV